MPFCRAAFSEALSGGAPAAARTLRLQPVRWEPPGGALGGPEADEHAGREGVADPGGTGARHEVAVGGAAGEAPPIWLLDVGP